MPLLRIPILVGDLEMTTATSPTTKTCPDCAENVDGLDAVCRFCGHRFAWQPAPPSPLPAPLPAQGASTVGGTVSSLSLGAAVALLGGLVMAAGSVGPWATTVLVSVSGTQGDGQITLV